MTERSMLIRGVEIFVTITSSYLAITSFFASSLYLTISTGFSKLLEQFNILTVSSAQVAQMVPILVSALVFLVVVYDYAIGKPENMIDIFEINLVLITPEVLSFSKLNWLNLIQKPQILEPTRNPFYVLVTGVVIMIGYLTLLFTSRFRETMSELKLRGADEVKADEIFTKQSALAVGAVMFAAVTSLSMYYLLPLIKQALLPLIQGVSSGYLYLGLLSVFVLIASIFVFYNEQKIAIIPETGEE
ncbi:MAG: hypothetical protein NWE89_04905 [Candidatus Bathyarchaeota archaeon]|nr:hypothetical protein [Candidatus Bathyarchaeota archaeon]